jgi:hypothetical protein
MEGALRRFVRVVIIPSRAFWDITHKKDKTGPRLILFFNALLTGLMASVICGRMRITLLQGQALPWQQFYLVQWQHLALFLVFFLFGYVYYGILFWFYQKMFNLGANVGSDFGSLIDSRFAGDEETAAARMKEAQDRGTRLDDSLIPEKAQKGVIMYYAFAPVLVANLLAVLLLLVALPFVDVPNTSAIQSVESADALLSAVFASPVWAIADFINIVVLVGWVPITIAIGLRDLGNTATTRLYVSSLIISVLLAYIIFFLRPTLGWNLNITDTWLK